VPAVITPNSGEVLFERAAVNELFHDVFNYRAKRAMLGFVSVGVTGHESGLMPLGALPQGRVARIAGPVRAHAGRRGEADGFYGSAEPCYSARGPSIVLGAGAAKAVKSRLWTFNLP